MLIEIDQLMPPPREEYGEGEMVLAVQRVNRGRGRRVTGLLKKEGGF